MFFGALGQKLGMTSFFNDVGKCIPVTALRIPTNRVFGFKFLFRDGYDAVLVTANHINKSKLTRPELGKFKCISYGNYKPTEFRVSNVEDYNIGEEFGISEFHVGEFVDIRCVSKGKGFAGVIKRHNFSTQPMSHGNSLSHRAPGSIGQCQSPGKVFKGKKMAGRLGGEYVTERRLEIISVQSKYNLLLIKGSIPGFNSCVVRIKKSVRGL